jgi:cell wall-associated NlpC family hydrolase
MKYILNLVLFLFLTSSVCFSQSDYVSPYSLNFTYSTDSLLYDILHTERGNPEQAAAIPYAKWYSSSMKNSVWGPQATHYSHPDIINGKSIDWIRQRMIAIAQYYIGYGYQHHHVPYWDPPADFKWKKTCMQKNGKGFDCSNFTAFVYNIGLGVKLVSNTVKQSQDYNLSTESRGIIQTAQRINRPATYEDFITTFQPGDLLFIRTWKGGISHVVIWVGSIGNSPDSVPLIIDSHGSEVTDSNGKHIPCGVHIRPFKNGAWYFERMSHAMRIIQ